MPICSNKLIESLEDPNVYAHAVHDLTVIETHISWVVLTGLYAYKIKKPVDLGFLDFSTLEKRHFYCLEELRLNRRLAPKLYREVVAITGTADRPIIDGTGPALEYAVKMLQFPQDSQLDRVLAHGELQPHHIDVLANIVANFHSSVAVAQPDDRYGDPLEVHDLVLANFDRVLADVQAKPDVERLQALRAWSQREYERLREALWTRERNGFVRECHGDMHLRNMALVDSELFIFDCIEFSETLRWIDVMSEVAFIVMDLDDRRQLELAYRFLNAYLEATGDYEGLGVLRYYLVYRAMVRAMVDTIRARQAGLAEAEKRDVLGEYSSYATLAESYTQPDQPVLMITYGLSGSGKTYVAQALLEHYPAIRIRSDVERKRLRGLKADARTRSDIDRGLYTVEATARTYDRLAELARAILQAGYTAIVDAAFLQHSQRDIFYRLATDLHLPFTILDCEAPQNVMQDRVSKREHEGCDASEANTAVLKQQIATREALSERETADAIVIDTVTTVDGANLTKTLRSRMRG